MSFEEIHTASVGGHTMAYRRSGSGTPLVLIHGIPTNSLLWRKVQPLLGPHYDVMAPDLIGYGRSDKPLDVSLSIVNQANWLTSWLETFEAPVVLVGHDIGGGIAQLVGATRPDLVRRLVLVDTIAYDSWPEPNIARLKDPIWDERFETIDLQAGFRRGLLGGMVNPDLATEDVAALYAAPFLADGAHSYLRAARALRTEDLLEAIDRIEAIAIPTTVVWGAADPYQHPSYGQRLADRLPLARFVLLDGVGHFVPEEAPERLAHLVID